MTMKQTIKLSAIVDKLDLKIGDPKATQEEMGADLILQVAAKAHRAEKEIYAFIADLKKCTIPEAEEADIVEVIKEIGSISGIGDFFKSAVKSKIPG